MVLFKPVSVEGLGSIVNAINQEETLHAAVPTCKARCAHSYRNGINALWVTNGFSHEIRRPPHRKKFMPGQELEAGEVIGLQWSSLSLFNQEIMSHCVTDVLV